MFLEGGWERKWTWQPLDKRWVFLFFPELKPHLAFLLLSPSNFAQPLVFLWRNTFYSQCLSSGLDRDGRWREGSDIPLAWRDGMGGQAAWAQNLMYAILFGCLHISFVNDPHKIYVSLHANYIKRQGSACFFCFVSFVNSLRARSPLSNSTHSMKTLLQSIHVACTIQQQNILLELRALPHNCR